MNKKSKKIRKNIMVNPDLVKRTRNVFKASSDSQAIEMALEQAAQRKTDDELWKATKDIVRMLTKYKIKPLFN